MADCLLHSHGMNAMLFLETLPATRTCQEWKLWMQAKAVLSEVKHMPMLVPQQCAVHARCCLALPQPICCSLPELELASSLQIINNHDPDLRWVI